MKNSKIVCLLLLISLCLEQVFAACDDNHCCFNNDCGNAYCSGGGGWVCRCEHRSRWSPRFRTGQCITFKDGQEARGNYRHCKSRKGVCGYCGEKQDLGLKCNANSDCKSDWCNENGSDTNNCGGLCQKKELPSFQATPFRTCEINQVGIFPTAASWLPGCQTATGAVFDGLKQLINLIPSEDDTVKDVVEHVLAPVEKIVEIVADFAGIGASICLGNFPGKTIVDPNDDDNMIVS